MRTFLLMTKNGSTLPKYKHQGIESAITEAKRLHEAHNTDVMILEIVAEFKKVEVPVTRMESKLVIHSQGLHHEPNDPDLPF